MKTGRDLVSLATEIQRRAENKKDFVAPVDKIRMETAIPLHPVLQMGGQDKPAYPLTTHAHTQLAEYLDIPTAYYKRMLKDDPHLLAKNVNAWLPEKRNSKKTDKPDRRMVRTLDGKVRAVLSDGYRALENEELFEAIFPVLQEQNLEIISCEITERRLYIKALDKAVQREIPVGARMGDGSHHIVRMDKVCPIIIISNSEIGEGALSIEAGVFTHFCTNLAIFDAKMRKYHTGSRAELSDEVYAMLTNDTKRLTDAAIWSQTRDLVRSAFDPVNFEADVRKLTHATEDDLGSDVVQVVERTAKRFGFTEATKKGVLQRLIEGGDLSRYGLHAAVTRHSADEVDYDEATTLERVGGKIIELPRTDWLALVSEEPQRKAA